MKLRIAAFAAILTILTSCLQAQDFQMERTAEGDSSLTSFKEEKLERMPYVQAYQMNNGTILKAANAEGWGLEPFIGYHGYWGVKYHTPELGLAGRYDSKIFSYRLAISGLFRQYNPEAIEAGKMYLSYATNGAIHVNLINTGYRVNVLSIFGEVGYLFGRHSYDAGKYEYPNSNGTITEVTQTVKYHGSGLTFGGGLEYRCQFFATGNALTVRAGYRTTPNVFVNDTKIHGECYIHLGFNIGINRDRVRPSGNKK